VQQQTGVPPKHMQHMQPASMHELMQSQQACSISQQALSPLVQVTQTPSCVIAQVQLHMAIEHWQTTMPFFMHTQLHMPSQSILHRFCKVAQAISSSQAQVIFMPPLHFSIFIVQRGTMHRFAALGMAPLAGIDMPGMGPIDIPGRSIVICANIIQAPLHPWRAAAGK
jgi:hypothetical protein